jgi:flagellar hook-length control protein FliK
MSLQLSAPPPASGSPPSSGAAPPGEPPGKALRNSAFAQLLARTAPAEGLDQTNNGETRSTRPHNAPSQGEHAPHGHAADRSATEAGSTSAAALAQTHTPPEQHAAAAAKADVSAARSSGAVQLPGTAASGRGDAVTAGHAAATVAAPGVARPSAGEQLSVAGAAHNSDAPLDAHTPTAASPASIAGSTSITANARGTGDASTAGVLRAQTTGVAPKTTAPQAKATHAPSRDGLPVPAASASAAKPTAQPRSSSEQAQSADAPAAPSLSSSTAPVAQKATEVRAASSMTATQSASPPATTTPTGEAQQPPRRAHELGTRAAARSLSVAGATATSACAPASTGPVQSGQLPVASAASPAAAVSLASLPAGVALQDVIESIHATVELAARQGMAQARIALEPAELGSVRIHLSQTADGLLARVSADTPAAAQALAGGRGELQQSLSSLGVSLLRLDISSSGQPDTRDQSGRSANGQRTRPTSAAIDAAVESEGLRAVDELQTVSPTGLDGARVDVLA